MHANDKTETPAATRAGPLVLWSVTDGVGRITLNRPAAGNAIHLPFAQAFATAVDGVAAGADTRAVLLDAVGRQFCVGGDVKTFSACPAALGSTVSEILDVLNPALLKLATLPVPVISAVHAAIGGAGIGLALCTDIVLASETMKLRGGYSALGLSPDAGASWFVTRRTGPAVAKRIFFCNQTLTAPECLRLGLVDALHSPTQLAPAAERMVARLAAGATLALGQIKRLCDAAPAHDLGTHLADEHQTLRRCAQSAAAREGLRAFGDKRAPVFSDSKEK